MSQIILQKDILSAIGSTSSGASDVLDMSQSGGATTFSCQAIYDVTAVPAAAAIATADITLSSDPTHPSEFHKASHGFVTGLKVQATTAGTLAVPLVVSTDYYAIRVDANYFALASSLANALAGTRIAITDVGVTSTTLTPVALAGATVTFQASNTVLAPTSDDDWSDLQAATSITVDGSVFFEKARVSFRWFRVKKGLTAGIVAVRALTTVIGDGI